MDMHFDGVIFQTHAAELRRRVEHPFPPFCVVDVRSPDDFAAGHIPGAVAATAADLEQGLPEGTDEGTEFVLVGSGPDDGRVRRAALVLRRRGVRRCVELPGGIAEWRALGYPVEAGRQQAA